MPSQHTINRPQKILDDIDSRYRDEEGSFAGHWAAADPKTVAAASRAFNECFGARRWPGGEAAASGGTQPGGSGGLARLCPSVPALPPRTSRCMRHPTQMPWPADMLEGLQHTVVEMPAELRDMHGWAAAGLLA